MSHFIFFACLAILSSCGIEKKPHPYFDLDSRKSITQPNQQKGNS